MSDPWWTWDTDDDDSWMSEFAGEDIRALVRERNRLLRLLEAEMADHATCDRERDQLEGQVEEMVGEWKQSLPFGPTPPTDFGQQIASESELGRRIVSQGWEHPDLGVMRMGSAQPTLEQRVMGALLWVAACALLVFVFLYFFMGIR